MRTFTFFGHEAGVQVFQSPKLNPVEEVKAVARPSNWKSPTTAVRIPQHAVEAVMALCKQLDQAAPSGFVQNPEPHLVTIEDNGKIARYILQAPSLNEDELKAVDDAITAIAPDLESLSPDKRFLLFARLVEATMQPFSTEQL